MNAEAEALGDLLNRGEGRDGGPQIIAAGGGLIDNPPALALLEKAGALTRVYLEVPANTAWERISAGAEKNGLPPFLDTQNPRETHRALHERRAAAYRKWARFTINGEGKTPEEIAGEIVGLL
jgi:shikimate kinase